MTEGVFLSWSSGKDSAWTLATLRDDPRIEVCGLVTTVTVPFERVSMHGVRRELLALQAERAGLPLVEVEIPSPCDNDTYEARMVASLDRLRAAGAQGLAFGDLFLEDIRAYRERLFGDRDLALHFPLWSRPTHELAREMQAGGLRAILTCIDPKVLPREFAGAEWTPELIEKLPEGVDPCGENGEFHTFVFDCPSFSAPIDVEVGEVVERGGFVFADVSPA